MFNLGKIYRCFVYSLQGMRVVWRQVSIREEVVLGGIGGVVLWGIGTPALYQVVFWILLLVVIATETLYTCIEYIGDKIDPSQNDFTKDIKDMGSFAVLCVVIATVLWWGYSVLSAI